MRRPLLFFSALLCVSAPIFAAGTALFSYKGKPYTQNDLPPGPTQNLYDLEKQYRSHQMRVIEEYIIEDYLKTEAEKKKKTPDALAKELMKLPTITDKEAKAWYDANKAMVGDNTFEAIKADIIRILESKSKESGRKNLLELAQSAGKFQSHLPEPEAPVVEIKMKDVGEVPTRGNKEAKVSIIEFADYRCPHCMHASTALDKVFDKYKDKLQFTFLHFPLQVEGVSRTVAEGAVCANSQNKFWDYHHLAFKNQKTLSKDSPLTLATELKLNLDTFKKCLASDLPKKAVDQQRKEGERIGVQGTPAIYINGKLQTSFEPESLEKVLLAEIAKVGKS